MRLSRISNHIQIWEDADGEKLMLQNLKEKDFAFKRVMLDRRDARTMRELLNTLELDEEEGEGNNESGKN
jgi:hypothetical protein